jgi:hypothetical protein
MLRPNFLRNPDFLKSLQQMPKKSLPLNLDLTNQAEKLTRNSVMNQGLKSLGMVLQILDR